MAHEAFGIGKPHSSPGTGSASVKDRIALTLFGLRAAYCVVYPFVLAARSQV